MKRQHRAPEVELCQKIADELTRDQWDVRHSVRFQGYEIDLVGVRHTNGVYSTIAVEAKERLTVELLDKAVLWSWWSTFTLVATQVHGGSNLMAALQRVSGIGYRVRHETVLAPVATTRAMQKHVDALAAEALKSSTGLIASGGARSPIRVRGADLLAEKAANHMREIGAKHPVELSAIVPEASPRDADETARVLNGRRGRHLGYRARKFGTTYLIVPR